MLLVDRNSNEIDKQWIEGIRKSWKAWTKQYDKFPGRILSAPSMDYKYIEQAAAAARSYLGIGLAFIKRLREDLLINKGFWTRPTDSSLKAFDAPSRGKVVELLRQAEEAISDGTSKITYVVNDLDPNWKAKGRLPGVPTDYYDTQEKFDRYVRTISLAALGAATNADAIISRKLLRHLTSMLPDSADAKLDYPGHEPPVVKVGSVTVIFHDTPDDPGRIGSQAYDGNMARHPQNRATYIQLFKDTEELLRRRGLGMLWYGQIFVGANGSAPPNNLGADLGVGALYYRQGDKVIVYNDPTPGLPRLVAHELGHRYYYKYMDDTDRARFSEWFGKVAATTSYGALVSPEDFAEVFADYVMGTDLTRDQIDRLKEFLGRSRRSEAIVPRMATMLGELRTLLA